MSDYNTDIKTCILSSLKSSFLKEIHVEEIVRFSGWKSSQTDTYIPYTVILTLILTRNKHISQVIQLSPFEYVQIVIVWRHAVEIISLVELEIWKRTVWFACIIVWVNKIVNFLRKG